jgi:hypothetical protein
MNARRVFLLLVFAWLGGCGETGGATDAQGDPSITDTAMSDADTSAAGDRIEPGVGVVVAGTRVALKGSLAAIEAALGAPSRRFELNAGGDRWLEYAALGLVVTGDQGSDAVSRVQVGPGFAGTTVDGVGVGYERSTDVQVPGTWARDPFLGASIDRARGIGLVWNGDRVARVVIFAATGL